MRRFIIALSLLLVPISSQAQSISGFKPYLAKVESGGCAISGLIVYSIDSSSPNYHRLELFKYELHNHIPEIIFPSQTGLQFQEAPRFIRQAKTYEQHFYSGVNVLLGFNDSIWVLYINNNTIDNRTLRLVESIKLTNCFDAQFVADHLLTYHNKDSGSVLYKWAITTNPNQNVTLVDSIHFADSIRFVQSTSDWYHGRHLIYFTKGDTGYIRLINGRQLQVSNEILYPKSYGTPVEANVFDEFGTPIYVASISMHTDSLFVTVISFFNDTVEIVHATKVTQPLLVYRGFFCFYYVEPHDSISSRIIELAYFPAIMIDTLVVYGFPKTITDGMAIEGVFWNMPSPNAPSEYLWRNAGNDSLFLYSPKYDTIGSSYIGPSTWIFMEGIVSCVGGISNTRPYPLRIYPNPTASHITIETADLDKSQSYTLEVFDIMGRILLQEAVVAGDAIQVDLSAFTPGLYVVALSGQTVRFTARVVRQ